MTPQSRRCCHRPGAVLMQVAPAINREVCTCKRGREASLLAAERARHLIPACLRHPRAPGGDGGQRGQLAVLRGHPGAGGGVQRRQRPGHLRRRHHPLPALAAAGPRVRRGGRQVRVPGRVAGAAWRRPRGCWRRRRHPGGWPHIRRTRLAGRVLALVTRAQPEHPGPAGPTGWASWCGPRSPTRWWWRRWRRCPRCRAPRWPPSTPCSSCSSAPPPFTTRVGARLRGLGRAKPCWHQLPAQAGVPNACPRRLAPICRPPARPPPLHRSTQGAGARAGARR